MDYPQFLGPHRNGTVTGVSLARDWEAQPPRILWRRPVEAGHSGFAVSGGVAVTQEQQDEEERITNYDLATGNLNWVSSEKTRYSNAMTGGGPRATPTIADGRVYAIGGTGILKALDLQSGETLWKHDVLTDNGAEVPMYGVASSPLVVDGRVVVPTGGADGQALVAYDAETGDKVWSGGDDPLAYSSPFLTSLADSRLIVTLNHNSVTGHDPDTGRLSWRQEWPDKQSNAVQPLPIPGDRLLVSAGWGMGAKLYQISANDTGAVSSELVWESIHLKSKFSNPVYYEGFVYGLDDGIMICLDPEDGQRVWKRGRYGHGQVLLVDDLLLIQTEHGEIALVEPSPEGHRELARFRFTDEKIWNMPAIAGRYLLVRNDREALLIELPVSS
jgi:outer membrane protein assembly factor BamB